MTQPDMLSARPVIRPGPDHPITITRHPRRIVVRVGGHTVADSRRALNLQEANYPSVYYVPRADADVTLLERSNRSTYCPYKGNCSYYSIPAGGERASNAVWSYENPHDAVAAIKDYLAFYADRVDIVELAG